MTVVDADKLTRSHDCKTAGCPNEARSPVGRYSYCDHCRTHRQQSASEQTGIAAGAQRPPVKQQRSGFVDQLVSVRKLAGAADKARAKAEAATKVALAAKRDADQAAEAYKSALREATA